MRVWVPNRLHAAGIRGKDLLNQDLPVVLVLHGLACRSAWMSPMVNRWINRPVTEYSTWAPPFIVVGLDLPEISRNPEHYGHIPRRAKLVDRVSKVITTLSEQSDQKVIVAGFSLGGLIGGLASAKIPDRIRAFMPIAPGFAPKIPTDLLKEKLNPWTAVQRLWSADEASKEEKPSRRWTIPHPFQHVIWFPQVPTQPMTGVSSDQRAVDHQKLCSYDRLEGMTIASYLRIAKMMATLPFVIGKLAEADIPVQLHISPDDGIVNSKQAKKRLEVAGFQNIDIQHYDSPDQFIHDFNTHPALHGNGDESGMAERSYDFILKCLES